MGLDMPSLGVHRKLPHLNLLLWNHSTKLKQIWLGRSLGGPLLKLCPTVPTLHSRWLIWLKIEIASIVHCCFVIKTIMSSTFNCSYMSMSSLTYILIFSVKFFVHPMYTDYANWAYFDKRSHLNLLLWNHRETKFGWNGHWVVPFQNCVQQIHPAFKIAAVTKNSNFFKCPLHPYYPLANEVAKGYSNATVLPSVRPSVTSLWTL